MMLSAAQRHPHLAGAIGLFALLVAAYSFSVGLRATTGASITGDEPFYLLTTQSLLDDGDLDLRNQYERESYRSYFDHPDGLWQQMVPTSDGRLLSPHDPGLSVVVIPGFVLAGLPGAQVELMLLAALTMALAFVLVAKETGRPLLSWLAAAAVGLSATAFVYATEIYPEFPAALCIVLCLLLVRSMRGSIREGLLLAALLSGLAWLGIKYVPLGGLIAVYFMTQAPRPGRLWFLAATGISGAVYVWLHYAIFDDLTPYSVNTVYEGAPALDVLQAHVRLEDRAYRIWGLFIDRRFGIGHWAPVFLLVLPALPLLLSRGRLGLTVFCLIGMQVMIATFVAITMMGWWFPGRTLVAVLPLFTLVLVVLIEALPRFFRWAVGLLGAWSVAITMALARAASNGEIRLAVDPFDMSSPVFQVPAGLFPNYVAWGEDTVVLTAGWLALSIAVLIWLTWREHRALLGGLARRIGAAATRARSRSLDGGLSP
jgi:hypothetical protein